MNEIAIIYLLFHKSLVTWSLYRSGKNLVWEHLEDLSQETFSLTKRKIEIIFSSNGGRWSATCLRVSKFPSFHLVKIFLNTIRNLFFRLVIKPICIVEAYLHVEISSLFRPFTCLKFFHEVIRKSFGKNFRATKALIDYACR